MSIDKIVLSERLPDCRAELRDTGNPEDTRIPVCLGGTAVVGCSNAEMCQIWFNERHIDEGKEPPRLLTLLQDGALHVVGTFKAQ